MTEGAGTIQTERVAETSSDRAGKYLTFKLADEEYGFEILKVKEIIGMMDITKVPRTPDFVRGVVNLRGKVIPVIDLRTKFGLESTGDTDETCIIVVEVAHNGESLQTGILVDTVSEVLDIMGKEIENTPEFGKGINTRFILGMAKSKEDVKILLNIEEVLTSEDLTLISDAALKTAGASKSEAVN